MTNLFIKEHWINRTENYSCGDSGLYETFTDNKGQLFKALQKEYGRCVGKMYVDKENKVYQCGWVFEKIKQYDDTNEKYIAETWVSLHDREDTITRTEHLHLIS